jgi:AraC family transcriptional regulator
MALKPATRLDYGTRIARSMALLARDLDRPPSLEELASAAAFSPCHFHRIYRMVAGETPAGTLTRMRLIGAAAALVTGAEPVEQVARKAGYSGAASFTRAFRAAHGVPPAAYRARGGLGAVLRHPGGGTKDSPMSMNEVTIRDLPPLRLAVVSHRGDYSRISGAFDQLLAWAKPRGLVGPETRFFGRYFGDPYSVPMADWRSEATLTVPAGVQGEGLVQIVELPALRVAALRFKGPYAELGRGYDVLYRDWLPGSGEEPDDFPPMDESLNNPRVLPPSEWLTEILVPLRPR